MTSFTFKQFLISMCVCAPTCCTNPLSRCSLPRFYYYRHKILELPISMTSFMDDLSLNSKEAMKILYPSLIREKINLVNYLVRKVIAQCFSAYANISKCLGSSWWRNRTR
jgi:hypothetical protein